MKKSISQKDQIDNQKVETVTEEFTGKNLTRFGGAGLIRRFFQRHHIQEKIEQGVPVAKGAGSVNTVSARCW